MSKCFLFFSFFFVIIKKRKCYKQAFKVNNLVPMTLQHCRCRWSRALWQVSGRAWSCKKDPCLYDVNKNTAPDNILKLFSRISSVHNTIHVPQRLNIFILKNLDSMSNEMLFRLLGSKFWMRYLKFLKKDRKKLLKDH